MNEVLRDFATRPKFGSGPGLSRSEKLLELLKLTPMSTIGVTGSNGKGSTSTMAAALLSAAGLRTGLYTSPHFLEPTERFRIDGNPISLDLLEDALRQVTEAADKLAKELGEEFSRFELLTAAAWYIFKQERVDAVVMEVGIGGRYCPTKLGKPSVTALTSLDLEHSEILGSTLELIGCDKLELTPKGGVCYAALPENSALRSNLADHARSLGISLVLLEEAWPKLRYLLGDKPCLSGVTSQGNTLEVPLPLLGPWQAKNAALAISCVQAALTNMGKSVSWEEFKGWTARGLSAAQVPGRFTQVHEAPLVIVDAAHTPDAIRQVVEFISKNHGKEGVVLCGISASKPVPEMAFLLSSLPYDFYVSTTTHGGADPQLISSVLQSNSASVLGLGVDLKMLLRQAMARASQRAVPLFVLGGLFFAAEVSRTLLGKETREQIYL
jgi:dihydrofolate synthase/folylpolyglutamate synthase